MFTVWVPNVVFAETYSGAGFPFCEYLVFKEPFLRVPMCEFIVLFLTLVVLTYLGLSLFC